MILRVVLDTNIFISGIFWEGNYCSQIIDAWRAGKIVLVTSPDIMQELVETMYDFKIEMPEELIRKWQTIIIENSLVVLPNEKVKIVESDMSDNKFFEAAIVGEAKYVVSQDKHILRIKEHNGIKTIQPEEFVKILNS